MEKIISGRNAKILNVEETPPRKCSCTKNATCPLKNIVYHAKVTQSDNIGTNYIGQTSLDFKARLAVHKQTFKDPTVSQTSLSIHLHKPNERNIKHEESWRIIGKGKPYTPSSKVCILCDNEKFNILFRPEIADLNAKSEFYSHLMHIKPKLLIRRKDKGPG